VLHVNARLELLSLAFENSCVKTNVERPTLYWLSHSLRTLVSGNIKFVRIFAGVL